MIFNRLSLALVPVLWAMTALGWSQVAVAQTSTSRQPFSHSLSESQGSAPAQGGSSSTQTSYNALHVNPTLGHDSASGSQRQPLRTITHALNIAAPNTVIVLAPGIYSRESGEQFPLQLKPGVTIQGQPGSGSSVAVIIGGGDFTSPSRNRQNAAILTADASGLANVVVSNPTADGHGVWIEQGSPILIENVFTQNDHSGVVVAGSGAPVLQRNYFSRNTGVGLAIYGQSQADVRDNQFEASTVGILIAENAQPRIAGNRVLGNQDGIVLLNNARPQLQNNQISQNRRNGIVEFASAGQIASNTPGPVPVIAFQPPVSAAPSPAPTEPVAPAPTVAASPTPQPPAQAEMPEPALAEPDPAPSRPSLRLSRATVTPILPAPTPESTAEPEPSVPLTVIAPAPEIAAAPEIAPAPEIAAAPEIAPAPEIAAASPPMATAAPLPDGAVANPPAPPELSNVGPIVPVSATVAPPRGQAADLALGPLDLAETAPLPDAIATQSTPAPVSVPALAASPRPAAQPPTATESAPPARSAPNLSRLRQRQPTATATAEEAPSNEAPSTPAETIQLRVEPAPRTAAAPPSAPVAPVIPDNALRVPGGNIPIGSGGSATLGIASRLPGAPPPPPNRASALGLHYRVLVSAPDAATQARVRSHVADAFRVRLGDQVVMQAGVYPNAETAESLAELLRRDGLEARVEYTP